jgi:hypothetical protein
VLSWPLVMVTLIFSSVNRRRKIEDSELNGSRSLIPFAVTPFANGHINLASKDAFPEVPHRSKARRG